MSDLEIPTLMIAVATLFVCFFTMRAVLSIVGDMVEVKTALAVLLRAEKEREVI